MGWSTYHRNRGEQTNVEHFAEKLADHCEIIAHGTVHGVFYAAVRDKRDATVYAAVILTQWTRGEYNFGYKFLTETCGPGHHQAPKAVLNALTPTTEDNALAWRAQCTAHHAQRDFVRTHLTAGDVVVFAQPLTFTDGSRHDRFAYGPRGILTAYARRFNIPGWRDSVVEIVKANGARLTTPAGKSRQSEELLAA